MDALAAVDQPVIVQLLERLAISPDVPVDKLQALLDMQRSITAERASIEFNAALTDAQTEMRPVAADAENPQTRSRYASYKALDGALRPIYTKHGFSLSFDTDVSPIPDHMRVLCYVAHRGGHSRTYKIDIPNDGKGAKGGDVMTKTHATGAGGSYGMRYLLRMVWNVAIGEDDTDGNGEAFDGGPKGMREWWDGMEGAAEEGLKTLEKAWQESPSEFKHYVVSKLARHWSALKAKAAKVKR
jgi:hypothetical protein